jgi:hypothetical protein
MTPWRRPPPPPPVPLDPGSVREVVRILEERLRQVEVYGVGGCPACHDAELRGMIARLKRLAEAPAQGDP